MPALSFDDLDEPRLKATESAVRGHEGGGPGVVSPQGAEGPGQIMPGTFRQHAYPGERLGNPADNVAVSNRIIREAYGKYGGDVGRVATDYFSGPGNVAPSGATPWKQNRRDVNEPVSAYVANVEKRMPKQQPLDFSDLDGAKKGPLDFGDLDKPWRVSPAQEGPRAGPARSPNQPHDLPLRPLGAVDPSVIARQKIAPQPATEALAHGVAPLATPFLVSQWLTAKAAHGYDWAKQQPPDLISGMISGAMGKAQDWTANKLQDVATGVFKKMGVDNPETQAHNLTSFVLFDLPMSRVAVAGAAGEMIKSPAIKTAEGEVVEGANHPAIREAGTDGQPGFTTTKPPGFATNIPGVEHLQKSSTYWQDKLRDHPELRKQKPYPGNLTVEELAGLESKTIEGTFVNREEGAEIATATGQADPEVTNLHSEDLRPQPVGAAATPTHEILAANVRAKEATLGAVDPTFRQNMRRAANALKSITAPETSRDVDTGARTGQEAAANIREKIGTNEREKQISAQALNQYYKMFNGVTPEEGLTVLKWLQSEPGKLSEGGYEPTPETSAFMTTFRKEMKGMQRVLETLPKTEDMNFKQNFVSQMWQNPEQTLARMIGGKGGSNYFTKKTVWDSYEDGIRQGGIPLSTNPLEIGLRYIENARNLITQYQILDEGGDTGRIVWRNPGNEPAGWTPLKGRAEYYKGPNLKAYAPPGYAQVYNNYVSVGPQGAGGDLLTAVQRTANAATQVSLGLSGFHGSLMMQESMASGIANAIDNITRGKVLTGAGKLAEAVVPGLYGTTSILRAKEGIEAYLNKEAGNPRTQKAVRALTAANFRMRGRGAITDEYRASFLPDLVTSFRTGRMKMEAAQATADIIKHPLAGTGRQVASLVFRTLDTVSAPIFQYMVPRLKTGAALDMMYTYMRRKPNASDLELAAYARQVSNIIDDRFGEMNHDNIFLSRFQKQIMQSAVVSYSYEYGSARAAAGASGNGDTARFLKGGWTPQMSYPIALFMSMAIHSAMYQYLMTGKAISSMQDVAHPQTGGTDPRSGQPGRATLPNQLNQVFGAMNNPGGELYNKLNAMWKLAHDLTGAMGPTGGYDYKGDPIVDKNTPGIDQMAQAVYYAMHSLAPIGLSQQPQPGSAIPRWQGTMGIRDAPHRAVDPQGSAGGLRYINAEKAVAKRQHDGELPRYIPHAMKQKLIQQEMNKYRGISQ